MTRPAPAVLAGAGLLAVLVLADLLTGDGLALVALMAIVPLVTAVSASVRETLAITGAAGAVAVAAGTWNDDFGTGQHLVRCGVVVSAGLIGAYTANLRDRREERLAHVTSIADVVQQAVLRPLPSRAGHVRLAGCYQSAEQGARVGGDLYEAVVTERGVRVVLGDVRGKGLAAVRLAAGVLGAYRLAVHTRESMLDVARDLDGYVAREAGDEEFVTAVFVEFAPDGVRIVNCGHHPPFLVRTGQPPVPCDAEAALPLGFGSDPRAVRADVRPGDRLVLYTDGLVEARDARGRFLGIESALDGLDAAAPEALLAALVARLRRHVAHQLDDDLAILVAQPDG